jgi:hypothetical protein
VVAVAVGGYEVPVCVAVPPWYSDVEVDDSLGDGVALGRPCRPCRARDRGGTRRPARAARARREVPSMTDGPVPTDSYTPEVARGRHDRAPAELCPSGHRRPQPAERYRSEDAPATLRERDHRVQGTWVGTDDGRFLKIGRPVWSLRLAPKVDKNDHARLTLKGRDCHAAFPGYERRPRRSAA